MGRVIRSIREVQHSGHLEAKYNNESGSTLVILVRMDRNTFLILCKDWHISEQNYFYNYVYKRKMPLFIIVGNLKTHFMEVLGDLPVPLVSIIRLTPSG